jgi:tRNA (guanine6-N2)-methyltransferase
VPLAVMWKVEFFATTSPGLEDLACREIERLTGGSAVPDVAKVFFQADIESVYLLHLKASLLNKIFIALCRQSFTKLDDLYRIARGVDYGWIIDKDQSFAVRSERIGVHDFTSMDVSRVVGQAAIDSYQEAYRTRLKVDLDEPDVEIYALVRDDEFVLGVNTTGRSLHKRGYKVYEHPAALKPTIASAMLEIAEWPNGEGLIDPMCGGATIPIEAAFKAYNIPPNHLRRDFAFLRLKCFAKEEFEEIRENLLAEAKTGCSLKIFGMEKYAHHLRGGIRNAEKADVLRAIKFIQGDATIPEHYPKETLTHVVVNPPYGIRMIPSGSPKKLYVGLIKALKKVVQIGTLVLISGAYKRFEEAASECSLEITETRMVSHGDLRAKIYKCKI